MDEIVTTEIPLPITQRAPSDQELHSAADLLRDLRGAAESIGALPAAAQLHFAMGRVYADHLGDLRSAAVCYQNAFRLDPAYLPNLEAARQLFTGAAQLERARALHEREEALLASSADRAESLRAQAILLVREGRLDEAERRLQRALELLPDDPALLSDAAACALARGDRLACAKLLVRAGVAMRDDVQKAEALRRALALLDEAPDGEQARALREDALVRLSAADPRDPVAWIELVRSAQAADDWEAVLRLCRERATRTGAAADRAVAACVAAFRLGRPAEAFADLRPALEEGRRDPGLLALLTTLTDEQHSPDLPHVLRLRAAASDDPSERAGLKARAAALAKSPLDQEQFLGEALADDPDDAAAIALHARLVAAREPASAAERFSILANACRERDPARATELDLHAAVALERAALRGEAATLARAVLDDAPRPEVAGSAVRLLQRALPHLGRITDLVQLFENVAASLPRGPAAELMGRAAVLASTEPDLRPRSVELARRSAELARGLAGPRSLEIWTAVALRDGDLASLARALETRAESAEGADAADLLVEAAELARATRDDERALALFRRARTAHASAAAPRAGLLAAPDLPRDDRIDLLEEELRSADSVRAPALRAERAALLEQAGRIDEAAQESAAALCGGPGDMAVLRRVARLHTLRGDHPAAVAALVRIAEATADGPLRAEAYARAAEDAEWRLGDARRALELYTAAANAHDSALPRAHLARLYAWLGRFAEAAQEYEKLASAAQTGIERAEALRHAAGLHAARTGQKERAAELYRTLLAESPDDDAAAAALLRLVADSPGQAGRKERGALRAQLATKCRDRRCAAMLRAESAYDRLGGGERDRGIAEYRRALALNPRDRIALDAVEEALRAGGDTDLLARHLAFRSAQSDGALRAAFAVQQGDLLARAGQWEQAAAAYEQALAADPASPLARAAAERAARRGRAPTEPAATDNSRPDVVPTSAPAEADSIEAAAARADAEALRRIAEFAGDSQPDGAIAAHRAILAVRIDERSLRALVHLFQLKGDAAGAEAAAAVLVGIAAATEDEAALYEAAAKRPLAAELPRVADDARVRFPADGGPVRDLLRAAALDVAKALAADVASRGEKVRGDNAVRRVCAAIAGALGVGEPALFVAKADPATVLPIADPPGVLIGIDVPKRYRSRHQRFLYARAIAHLRRQTATFAALSPESLATLTAEIVRASAPHDVDLSRLPPRDASFADALDRTLGPDARTRLAPLAAVVAAEMPESFAPLALALRATAERTALVLCGDPAAALQIVVAEVGGDVARAEVAQLAAFAVSEAYLRPR